MGRLKDGMRLSGFSIERYDRVDGLDEKYVTTDGQKSGKRFSLTGPGFERAREIARALLA